MNRTSISFALAGALLLATALCGAALREGGEPAAERRAAQTRFAAGGDGPVTFHGELDRAAVLAGQEGVVGLELIIAAPGEARPEVRRRPTDLVIVLDRSGSMSGEKMEHALASVRQLVSQLGAADRFALVTYADGAAVTIPLAAATAEARQEWSAAIAGVVADGGTNISRGLDLAADLIDRARQPGRVPHAILISDGLANQGDPSHAGLVRRARRAAGGEYMLSAVGVGADFNEDLMTALADAGTGNYYYLRDSHELASVFARELDSARTTVASALAVHVEPGPGVYVLDAAGYPLEEDAAGVLFRPGSLFAGQERRIWVTLGVAARPAGSHELGRFSLRYGEGEARRTLTFSETPRVASVTSGEEFYAGVDVGAWSRAVVTDAYNRVRQEVARDVQAGRRDEALGRLRAFRDQTEGMNARLQSAPVAQQLGEVDTLEAEVQAAFSGPDQARKRNELGKASSAAAVDARRSGAKKGEVTP